MQSNQTSLSISPNKFNAGTTNITLNITSITFKTWASATATILVTNDTLLSVTFSLGSQVSVTPADTVSLKALLGGTCGYNGSLNYEWNYSASNNSATNDSAPALILSNFKKSNKGDKLIVPSGSLYPGYNYTFTVTVSTISQNGLGAITGSGSIQVICIPSSLVLTFSKASGIISKASDLKITALASDPDNSSSDITIE